MDFSELMKNRFGEPAIILSVTGEKILPVDINGRFLPEMGMNLDKNDYLSHDYLEAFTTDSLAAFKKAIADVCAGSGCLGITLSKELNAKELYLTDISKDAIDVTKKNLEIHNVDGHVFIGDSLEPLIKNNIKCDILISNPPYILKKEDVDKSVLDFEPHNALFTDESLHVYDQIISNIKKIMNKPSIVFFEIGYDLKPLLEEKIKKYLSDCEYLFSKDMNGNYRILSITLK